MMTEGDYTAVHYYWEECPDNEWEYTLSAVWEYESNSDMPDYWHLKELEVFEQDRGSPDLDLSWQGKVWMKVEAEGPDVGTLEKVCYL